MAGLADLAAGMRLAGGAVSPGVFQGIMREDALNKELAQRMAIFQQQQAQQREQMRMQEALRRDTLSATQEDRQARLLEMGQARLDRLEQTRMQIEARREQTEAMLADRALSREQQAMVAQQNAALKQQGLALQAQIAQGNQALRALQIQTMGQQAVERQDRERTARIDRQVEGLSKRGQDLTEMYQGIQDVNNIISPYVSKAQNIPGVGFGTNMTVPWLGIDLSGPFLGEEGKNVRSAVKNVANKILKAQSGAAVTLSEEVRNDLAMMSTGQFSEDDFLNAWPRVISAMQSNLDNLQAGFDPEAVKRYKERGGSLPFGQKLTAPSRPKQQDKGNVVDDLVKKYAK